LEDEFSLNHEIMKKILLLFFLALVFFSWGCEHDIPLGPDTHTTVNFGENGTFLAANSLNCTAFFEGTTRSLRVDVVDQDGVI